jgi:hypothetical protein
VNDYLSFVGLALLTLLNTIYVYWGCKAGMTLSSTFGHLIRTLQFWVHVGCILGFLIFGVLGNPRANIFAELFRLLTVMLFVMVLIVLATIWGVWKMSSSDKDSL